MDLQKSTLTISASGVISHSTLRATWETVSEKRNIKLCRHCWQLNRPWSRKLYARFAHLKAKCSALPVSEHSVSVRILGSMSSRFCTRYVLQPQPNIHADIYKA